MSPFRLYLITDRRRTRGRPLLAVVEAALRGGVEAVQLREKDLSARKLYDLAVELKALCHRHGALLLINDRIDVVLAVGADGVHLPIASFDPADARRLLGRDKFVAASTHGVVEGRAAQHAGADLIVCGPVFETPLKKAYGVPLGLDGLEDVAREVELPVLAIGGISAERVGESLRRGAAGVAVISAILEADDPEAAARQLSRALQDGAHSTS
jgi:thiamine-phosphate pyrophosphorylase